MKIINPIGRIPDKKEDFKAYMEPRACKCSNDGNASNATVHGPTMVHPCAWCNCGCFDTTTNNNANHGEASRAPY